MTTKNFALGAAKKSNKKVAKVSREEFVQKYAVWMSEMSESERNAKFEEMMNMDNKFCFEVWAAWSSMQERKG